MDKTFLRKNLSKMFGPQEAQELSNPSENMATNPISPISPPSQSNNYSPKNTTPGSKFGDRIGKHHLFHKSPFTRIKKLLGVKEQL